MLKRIFLILLAVLLATFAVATLLPFDGQTQLATVSGGADGLERYLSSHLFLQDQLRELKTRCLLFAGKREFDGVYVGSDRLLEPLQVADYDATAENIRLLSDYAQTRGESVNTQLMLVPNAAVFYQSELPALVDVTDQAEYIKQVYDQLPLTGRVDLVGSMSAGSTSNLYYRTDSHWTGYGAYLGYAAAARALGLRPYAADAFYLEHVKHDFLGNLYRRVLYGDGMEDTVSLYHYSGGDPVASVVKLTPEGTKVFPSVFFRDELEGENPYRVFLGEEDRAVVRVRSNRENGQKLLIYGDDTCYPLLQFLPLHYEEILVVTPDLLEAPLSRYCNPDAYDRVLFCFGVERFADAPLKLQ